MDDSEVILNFDRVDMNLVETDKQSDGLSIGCVTAAGYPGAQSTPPVLLGAGSAAGDCASYVKTHTHINTNVTSTPHLNAYTHTNTNVTPVSHFQTSSVSNNHIKGTDANECHVLGANYTHFTPHTRNVRNDDYRFYDTHSQNRTLDSRRITTRKPVILPDHFDGSISWLDYQAHFETCADVNEWDDVEKARFLIVSLRGPAQQVMGDLTSAERKDYGILINAIKRRFNPDRQTELYRSQLRTRKRNVNESLPELGQAIKRLVRLAYPNAGCELLDSLGRDYFLDAIGDSSVRLQIYQSRPTTIDEAVCVAIEFEAFQLSENQRMSGKRPTRVVYSSEPQTNAKADVSVSDLKTALDNIRVQQKAHNKEQSRHNKQVENDLKCFNERINYLEQNQMKLNHVMVEQSRNRQFPGQSAKKF